LRLRTHQHQPDADPGEPLAADQHQQQQVHLAVTEGRQRHAGPVGHPPAVPPPGQQQQGQSAVDADEAEPGMVAADHRRTDR
jgi:hypothetical protein